jgi:diphosphomevalonate decarboxylase
MDKATAVSCANIAFIKYWGKKDSKLNLPYNNSISMNLSDCLTTTTVAFGKDFRDDSVTLDGKNVKGLGKERVVKVLDEARRLAKTDWKAKVVSENNFPSDAGVASSASGFSALAVAASKAAGLSLSEKKLSILARLGSGSASRSIPDGFVEWRGGKDGETSYAVQIAKPGHWRVRDIVVVVSHKKKKASSTQGHSLVQTSPHFKRRLELLPSRIKGLRGALLERDFDVFGELLEEEAVSLHMMAMTSKPAIFYWNEGTFEVIHALFDLREKGIKAYFTMDAGPNVHVICLAKDANRVKGVLKKLNNVHFIIDNKPAKGARLVKKHLF